MLGTETPHFTELDVSVLRSGCGRASDPPVRTGQPGRQIRARSGLPVLPGPAGLRSNFAVRWLPQPDEAAFLTQDNSVIPAPDDSLGAIRRGRDGYEVTR